MFLFVYMLLTSQSMFPLRSSASPLYLPDPHTMHSSFTLSPQIYVSLISISASHGIPSFSDIENLFYPQDWTWQPGRRMCPQSRQHNSKHHNQRQPLLSLFGDPHEDQATQVQQMYKGPRSVSCRLQGGNKHGINVTTYMLMGFFLTKYN